MPKSSISIPLPRRPTRKAKEKASLQIRKYFKPKSLQTISEDGEVVYRKNPMKEKNNNTRTSNKRNFRQLSEKQKKSDEKESIGETKLKKKKLNSSAPKTSETKQSTREIELNQSEDPSNPDSSTNSSTSSLPELVIVLDSPVKLKNLLVVDSSFASNESVYGFDALQTDDPTDEEFDGESVDKRKPYWSLYKNRIAIVIDQEKIKTNVIDALFDSGPQVVNSMEVFPFKTPVSRRRSTAIWNTPPRYSILPKY